MTDGNILKPIFKIPPLTGCPTAGVDVVVIVVVVVFELVIVVVGEVVVVVLQLTKRGNTIKTIASNTKNSFLFIFSPFIFIVPKSVGSN
jgi:hypothetical protein